MKSADRTYWHELNRSYLLNEIDKLRSRIESLTGVNTPASAAGIEHKDDNPETSPALEILCRVFSLTSFEREILLLCAAVELDSSMQNLLRELNGDRRRINPTFGLALSVLPGAHWSALAPDRPLRYRQLIHPGDGETLTTLPLRIDERILHYITGWGSIDERLHDFLDYVNSPETALPAYYRELGENIKKVFGLIYATQSLPPVIQICGKDKTGIREIAHAACSHFGMNLLSCSSEHIPEPINECMQFIKLLEREAILTSSAILLEIDRSDKSTNNNNNNLRMLNEKFNGIIILSTPVKLSTGIRDTVAFELPVLSTEEQQSLWKENLNGVTEKLNGQLPEIAAQYRLDPSAIRAISRELKYQYRQSVTISNETDSGVDDNTLWNMCRRSTRGGLDDLAERIDSSVTWDDLVLPSQQMRQLRELSAQVKQRTKVYSVWGYADKSHRGLGINALFTGASGTGKTLAAEILANDLKLDLYRIDLSAVVSKYIGETEKNLARIFDAADGSGAVLLFDEADALFGKRSEVKDSHDRYANIEVGYLLQKMEAYRGLAILTTNMKAAIDTAFLRRIRFIIQFPFPDTQARSYIWEKVFPKTAPVKEIDYKRIAKINLAGGSIRNIALNSAFLAANDGNEITMNHIVSATLSELNKLEQPIPNYLASINREHNGK